MPINAQKNLMPSMRKMVKDVMEKRKNKPDPVSHLSGLTPEEVQALAMEIADGINLGATVEETLNRMDFSPLDYLHMRKTYPLFNSIIVEAQAQFAAMRLEDHMHEVVAGKKVGERRVETMSYDGDGNMVKKETIIEQDLIKNVSSIRAITEKYKALGRKEGKRVEEGRIKKPLTEEERTAIIEAEFMRSDEDDMAEIEKSNQDFKAACDEEASKN